MRRSGYTVVELVVALALSSVVVIAAAELIEQAMRLFRDAGLAARNPSLTVALAGVRRDIQDSAGVVPGMVGWSDGPLDLVGWDGRRLRLARDGDALIRTAFDVSGSPSSRRVVGRGLTAWWWRQSGGSAIDVRLTVLVAPDPAPGRRAVVERRTEVRRFAMRGAPDGRRW